MKVSFIYLLLPLVLAFRKTEENQFLLISTSKFWFNLRQSVNSLMIYNSLKDMGIKDENVFSLLSLSISQIILMIPEESACNTRNNHPGIICPYDNILQPNLYRNVELDFKKNDVSIEYWVDLIRGKFHKYQSQSKRLQLSSYKNFVDYANGHGGDGYMKLQDTSYLLDFEMEKVVREMEFLNNYKNAFFIADSCSAVTLYSSIKSNNTIIIGSSKFDQKSYSHGKDSDLLISKSDKYSLWTFNYFNNQYRQNPQSQTIQKYFDIFDPNEMNCDAELINNLGRSENEVKMLEFFSSKNPEFTFQKGKSKQWNRKSQESNLKLKIQKEYTKKQGEQEIEIIF